MYVYVYVISSGLLTSEEQYAPHHVHVMRSIESAQYLHVHVHVLQKVRHSTECCALDCVTY